MCRKARDRLNAGRRKIGPCETFTFCNQPGPISRRSRGPAHPLAALLFSQFGKCFGPSIERGGEISEVQFLIRLDIFARQSAVLAGHQKTGCVVQAFSHEALAKNLIPPRVGNALKLGPHGIVRQSPRLLWADRVRVMLEHHQITEPWPGRRFKGRLPVGSPKIRGITEGLLDTVVEVVAE